MKKALFGSNHSGLGEKLRKSVNSLIVDVWGVERKTSNSLKKYFSEVSEANHLSSDFLWIRIEFNNSVKVDLYYKQNSLFPLDMKQLALLMGIPIFGPRDIEKIIDRANNLLKPYGERHQLSDLYFNFSLPDQHIAVKLMAGEKIIATLPFLDLVNKLSIL